MIGTWLRDLRNSDGRTVTSSMAGAE